MTITINGSGTITGATTLATTPAVTQINSSSSNTPTVFGDSAGTQVGTVCRAWVQFVGSTGVKNGTFNVSSVTRSATGQYLLAFVNAMPNINYSVTVGSANASTSNQGFVQIFSNAGTIVAPTTSGFYLSSTNASASAYSDLAYICLAVFD